MMEDLQKQKIRNLVNSLYDMQKLRIATGNRIVQSFNIQMGQEPSTKMEEMSEEAVKMIEQLRKEYSRITDAYVNKRFEVLDEKGKVVKDADVIELGKSTSINKVIETMTSKSKDIKLIRNKLDYDLMSAYVGLLDTENKTNKILEHEVKQHPMWGAFFEDIKGCGPLMAAVCISYFNIDVARHASSFWKYAGLDTVSVVKDDGTVVNEGRAKKHAKLTVCKYIDKDGNEQEKHGLGYNPILKTKLVGVLGGCLLKANLRTVKDENGKPVIGPDGNKLQSYEGYAKCYIDYKNRLANRPDAKDLSDGHRHAMANRYMVKMFVRDLWVTWRKQAGYEVSEPYEVAKLGMKPHKYNEYHERVALETQNKKVV